MRLFLILLLALSMLTSLAPSVFAWDGYDYNSMSFIEIQQNQQLEAGREIEIYDYQDSKYKNVQVEHIYKVGNSIEVEVYDYQNNEYRTFDMNRQ